MVKPKDLRVLSGRMSQTVKALSTDSGQPIAATADDSQWTLYANSWGRSLRARNLSDLTVLAYGKSYRRLAEWALAQGCDNPEDIEKEMLEEFFAWSLIRTTRRGTKAASAAVAKDYRHLRVFFNWLADLEDVPSPMAKMSMPKVEETPVPVFTDDELRALLHACRGREFVDRRDTAIIRLFLDTGIRRAELANLDVDDVDLDEQLARVLGKGRKERTVSFGAKTAEALDAYIRARAKHKGRQHPALWLSDRTRDPLGYDGVHLMLQRRGRAAGVDNIHAHRFRHTAADDWFANGGLEGDAMRHFGWVTRTMVDRYGAAEADRRARRAARRMSRGDRV